LPPSTTTARRPSRASPLTPQQQQQLRRQKRRTKRSTSLNSSGAHHHQHHQHHQHHLNAAAAAGLLAGCATSVFVWGAAAYRLCRCVPLANAHVSCRVCRVCRLCRVRWCVCGMTINHCVGRSDGQLGDGSVSGMSAVPRCVEDLQGKHVTSLSCGAKHSIALTGALQRFSSAILSSHISNARHDTRHEQRHDPTHTTHTTHTTHDTRHTTHRIRRCVHVGVELQRPAGLRLQGRIPAAIAQTAAPHQGTLPLLPFFSFFFSSQLRPPLLGRRPTLTLHRTRIGEMVTMEWTRRRRRRQQALQRKRVASVATGAISSAALMQSGEVYTWVRTATAPPLSFSRHVGRRLEVDHNSQPRSRHTSLLLTKSSSPHPGRQQGSPAGAGGRQKSSHPPVHPLPSFASSRTRTDTGRAFLFLFLFIVICICYLLLFMGLILILVSAQAGAAAAQLPNHEGGLRRWPRPGADLYVPFFFLPSLAVCRGAKQACLTRGQRAARCFRGAGTTTGGWATATANRCPRRRR
jgi:hypothetical protein